MSNYVITISQADMQHDYFEIITPQQKAEIAYQPRQGDRFPPVATEPSFSLASGWIIVMMSTLYNRPPFGGIGEMELLNHGALIWFNGGTFPTPEKAQQLIGQHPEIVLAHLSGKLPFVAKVACSPYLPVTVRPLTGGCMAKAISKEDYVAGGGRPPL